MKLGMLVGYSGSRMNLPMDAIKHAESCGYDSVWTAEAYGHHADAGTLPGDGGHDGDESSAAL
jgi:alkanesulfonate monooxygenase SsuD/methylene tetrahydromethanopterin reductase-like flavin-dependent oxidoreductase (luciferase family)